MREKIKMLENHADIFANFIDVHFLSVILKSSTTTSPAVISSKLFIQRRNVLLPDPEGPMTQTTSPSFTSISMPLRLHLRQNSFSVQLL